MKVFLSSTAQDLVAYRQVADDTILRLSQQAVVMERFGPLPGTPVDECERLARESDVVICVVAHRYGFEPEKGRGSITRREVEAAQAARKDVLVWIVADDYSWTEKKEQDLLTDPTVLASAERVAEVAAGIAALVDFKAWLRKTFVCDTFTVPAELGRKIAIALSNYGAQRSPTAATASPKVGEIRIVHALQPALYFHGRDSLVNELTDWVADAASPDRVWSLVAAGGTGKTAIVERVVRDMRPGISNVLGWSFNERPDSDAFLRECNHLFLGEEEGPSGGRLERLERGLRDGRPHLIVLDGLESVQEDADGGRVRGELSDQVLRLLLQGVAAGLGRARALVTSRFPLVDLQDWDNRGYRETLLDDLTPDAAVAALRSWGVVGEDSAVRAAALKVGYHALSVAVIGSYLHSFADGRVEEVDKFNLDVIAGADTKAARLAHVLAFYAERLPADERDLIVRLSVFPRAVSVGLLEALIDAGGDVAGQLVKAKGRLLALLKNLERRGLVSERREGTDVAWTAHPFLREKFRQLLGCPAKDVFDVVARSLGSALDKHPTLTDDPQMLDRYERLIEVTRLAGRAQEAYEMYDFPMGGYPHLGAGLGEFQRGYRILSGFSPTGQPDHLGQSLKWSARQSLLSDFARYATELGRLKEAHAIQERMRAEIPSDNLDHIVSSFSQASDLLRDLGRLVQSQALAAVAVTANEGNVLLPSGRPLALRATAAHALGDIASARRDFAAGKAFGPKLGAGKSRIGGFEEAHHHIDLGELLVARAFAKELAQRTLDRHAPLMEAACHVLDARLDLIAGNDPTSHIEWLRAWTSRSGDIAHIIQAHLLSAQHFLVSGDQQTALGEAETGLLNAATCGFRLFEIKLLITLARIHLAWPDPVKAIQAAREALDLATHPECRYAWGEADAAQVWGEAYFANHEPELAHRAFTRALAVRKRIEHPGVAETERWLAMSAV